MDISIFVDAYKQLKEGEKEFKKLDKAIDEAIESSDKAAAIFKESFDKETNVDRMKELSSQIQDCYASKNNAVASKEQNEQFKKHNKQRMEELLVMIDNVGVSLDEVKRLAKESK